MDLPKTLSDPDLKQRHPELFGGAYDLRNMWAKICEDELIQLMLGEPIDLNWLSALTHALCDDPGLGIEACSPKTAANTWHAHHEATGKSLVDLGKWDEEH